MIIDFIEKTGFISDVSNDSRKITANSVFVAIDGEKTDGHDYIDMAIKQGAKAIVYSNEAKLPDDAKQLPHLKVTDTYYAYALLCEYFLNYPARKLNVCGITGTNGKTTTAFILQHIFKDAGTRCGLISTVKYDCGAGEIIADRTTPEAWRLQSFFRQMLDNSCANAVMEVSSHALAQHRCGSMKFKVAAFTNLTGDHLDYHHDMESYFRSKRILFDEYTDENSTLVINADDPYGQRLIGEFKDRRKVVAFRSSDFDLATSLIGDYNHANAVCAYLCALACGVAEESARNSIANFRSVPGRLERFELTSGASVFVDYAHTDDALSRALHSLRKECRGRLTVVFGCGGDRDRSKRPRMGKVACELADKIIVTSDNPRSEDPRKIIDDIVKGIPDHGKLIVEIDRSAAIELAMAGSARGEFILIAGKGHEDYQEINGVKHPFDDRRIVQASSWGLLP